jgi:hypothetical protein
MSKTTKLAILAAAVAIPASAWALQLTVEGDAGAGVSAGANAGAAGANAGVGMAADQAGNAVVEMGKLRANLGHSFTTSQAELDAITNLKADSKVTVIKIDTAANADMDMVTKAKTDNKADIDKLQTAINGSTDLKKELDAKSISVTSIVAADVADDGTLILYSAG